MGALSLYLEDEGVPTVHVSLVREHTEAIRPPRALWVPFMLGRPLGVPGDAAFQRRVTLAALKLLERPAGPVLEDFPEDAPAVPAADEASEPLACPVSFAGAAPRTVAEAAMEEMDQLQVWRDIAVKQRGRTAVGLLAAPMAEVIRYVGGYAQGGAPPAPVAGLRADDALRLACEDIKAFYMEAAAGQPGSRTAAEVRDWFWLQTAGGKLILALHGALRDSDDRRLRAFATGSLLPRVVQEKVKGD